MSSAPPDSSSSSSPTSEVEVIRSVVRFVRAALRAATLRHRRGRLDVLSDRLRRASAAGSLSAAANDLMAGLEVAVEDMDPQAVARFLAVDHEYAPRVLAWFAEQPRLVALLAAAKDEAVEEAITDVHLPYAAPVAMGQRHPYTIHISATCETSLSHGGDDHCGNAMLFRRIGVWTDHGRAALPAYSGNALRGQLRDLLADHFLSRLGLMASRSKPPVALWFFYALYSGGALQEGSTATAALRQQLGDHGAARSDGLRRLRDTLPGLSLLGCALGDRIISGKVNVGDLRPRCIEWGNGQRPVRDLLGWEFLTRREDYEGHESGEHQGMIALTEVLRAGTELEGGIDMLPTIMPLEASALGVALRLLQERGHIGGQARRDFGRVTLRIEPLPDPEPYERHLDAQRTDILAYLDEIRALLQHDGPAPERRPRKSRKTSGAQPLIEDAGD